MIIIHTETDEDSRRLGIIYSNLPNIIILKNESRNTIHKVLEQTQSNEVIMFLGHGDKNGLGGSIEEYSINIESVKYLRNKIMIGIWCYAFEFAKLYGLHGFFTNMFITNQSEAFDLGYRNQTQADIYRELDLFCGSLKSMLSDNIELSKWPRILKSSCNKEVPFVRYNYNNITYI